MTPSLRQLLHGLFDYAGMFPPAGLALEPALRTYAADLGEPDAWMLGRFVIGLMAADQLTAYRDLFAERPLGLSVLLGGGETTSDLLSRLPGEAARIAALRARGENWMRIESFEVKLPTDLQPGQVAGFLEQVEGAFRAAGTSPPLDVFELPPHDRFAASYEGLIAAFGSAMHAQVEAGRKLPGVSPCLKLRCGGASPSSYPSPALLAQVIAGCRDAGVPLKFTAGLHHPIRHYNGPARAWMHGFLNVFVAGVLSYALHLGRSEIAAILEEQNPLAFHFRDEYLGWADADATLGEVRYARAHRVVGIGTCSFDEPIADLRQLPFW